MEFSTKRVAIHTSRMHGYMVGVLVDLDPVRLRGLIGSVPAVLSRSWMIVERIPQSDFLHGQPDSTEALEP